MSTASNSESNTESKNVRDDLSAAMDSTNITLKLDIYTLTVFLNNQ